MVINNNSKYVTITQLINVKYQDLSEEMYVLHNLSIE